MHINLNSAWVTPAKVGVAGLAIGGGLGYLVARRKFDRDLETALMFKDVLAQAFPDTDPEQLALEFTRMVERSKTTEITVQYPEDFYDPSGPAVKIVGPSDVVKAQGDIPLKDDQGNHIGSVTKVENTRDGLSAEMVIDDPEVAQSLTGPVDGFSIAQQDPEPEIRNVFHDDWDMAEQSEIRARGEGPYTLHINEYHNRELGYPQQTLTWWAADEILSDENDVRVYDVNGVIGEPQWGVGSGDPDIVYIRNEKRHGEYEVIRKHGSYQNHIYGVQAEEDADDQDLKHSARIRRFRQE